MDKYIEKKIKNQVLTKMIKSFVSESNWELIKACSTFLMMVADETMEKQKQHKGNSCKNRFCPICAWKKARKDALALSIQMEYIKQEYKKEFIFVTLTAPNVEAQDLNDEIKKYNDAFQRLMQRKEVRAIAKGYVRKLEVTYNQDRDDYHPHFHVMIAVNKSYFTAKKQYIKHERWLELWQEATDNPAITQVDVRKVRHNNKKEVAEIAKYSAKDSDYLVSDEVFAVFYQALKGKRLIVQSGLFKESMKLWKAGELDKYKEKDMTEYVYKLLYNWGMKEYVLAEQSELTEAESKELNDQFVEEREID